MYGQQSRGKLCLRLSTYHLMSKQKTILVSEIFGFGFQTKTLVAHLKINTFLWGSCKIYPDFQPGVILVWSLAILLIGNPHVYKLETLLLPAYF